MELRPNITAWSYSRWSSYDECPFKAYLKFVLKRPEPSAPALERGSAIHKKCEDYLTGAEADLPVEVHPKLAARYAEIKALSPAVEQELAFTVDWKQTGWFDKNAWCRIKMDAMLPAQEGVVQIIDHKTGKVKDEGEYDLQLGLYALGGLLIYPKAERAVASLYFVDHGIIIGDDYSYERSDVEAMKKAWERRVAPMLTDTVYEPKPGNACRWCNFRKANGGECRY